MYHNVCTVIKDELDHLRKMCKNYTDFLAKGLDLDPEQLLRIPIRTSQNVPGLTGSGSTTLVADQQEGSHYFALNKFNLL
jgi:hypothetical protein